MFERLRRMFCGERRIAGIVVEKEYYDDYVEYNFYDGFFLLASVRKYWNGKRVVDVMKENVPVVNVFLDGGVKKFE